MKVLLKVAISTLLENESLSVRDHKSIQAFSDAWINSPEDLTVEDLEKFTNIYRGAYCAMRGMRRELCDGHDTPAEISTMNFTGDFDVGYAPLRQNEQTTY